MTEEDKKIYADALKTFDDLPEEERFKQFAQMESAKVCLGSIVDSVRACGVKLKDFYFDDANTPVRCFVKDVVDWVASYLKAGVYLGYAEQKETK